MHGHAVWCASFFKIMETDCAVVECVNCGKFSRLFLQYLLSDVNYRSACLCQDSGTWRLTGDFLLFIGWSLQMQDLFSKNYLQNSWLPLQNCENALHWLVRLRHEEQVLINLYLYSFLITFIICPCAFIAISRSSEVYLFSNLHLSVVVRIIKVQPCYQCCLRDQRKRKREFWKIEG